MVSKPQIAPKDPPEADEDLRKRSPPEADERIFLRELGRTFKYLESMRYPAMLGGPPLEIYGRWMGF